MTESFYVQEMNVNPFHFADAVLVHTNMPDVVLTTVCCRSSRGLSSTHRDAAPTVGENVERFAVGVHGGEARCLRGDSAPALQRPLQGQGPIGHHPQLFALHHRHLCPLGLGLVGVRLLDCNTFEYLNEFASSCVTD